MMHRHIELHFDWIFCCSVCFVLFEEIVFRQLSMDCGVIVIDFRVDWRLFRSRQNLMSTCAISNLIQPWTLITNVESYFVAVHQRIFESSSKGVLILTLGLFASWLP